MINSEEKLHFLRPQSNTFITLLIRNCNKYSHSVTRKKKKTEKADFHSLNTYDWAGINLWSL